jgi:hypothetical protein
MSERVRSRDRKAERRPPEAIVTGPPSKLVRGLAIDLEAVPNIYEKNIEPGAKIALALIMYYDPSTEKWYPAAAPRGIPETVVKAYKPDTNSYEYLRLDEFYQLLTKEYNSEKIWNNALAPVSNYIINADETVAQSITLDTFCRSLVSIFAMADAATTFHLDLSLDNITWFNDVITYSNTTKVNDVIKTAFRYVRLRSDAAGVAGNKVTLVLAAKGD